MLAGSAAGGVYLGVTGVGSLYSGFYARIGVAGALLAGAPPVLAQAASGNPDPGIETAVERYSCMFNHYIAYLIRLTRTTARHRCESS